MCIRDRADGGIEDYIMQVFSFAQSNPWPDKWFEHCRKELETTDFGELDRTEWMRFLLEDVRTQAEEWERQLEDAVKLCMEEDLSLIHIWNGYAIVWSRETGRSICLCRKFSRLRLLSLKAAEGN